MGFDFQDFLGLIFGVVLIATPIFLWKRKHKVAAVAIGALFVSILVAISIPGYTRSRSLGMRGACINNLRVIERAKNAWATQNNKKRTDVPEVEDLFGSGKVSPEMPSCPGGGKYTIGAVNQKPTCTLVEQGHILPDEPH